MDGAKSTIEQYIKDRKLGKIAGFIADHLVAEYEGAEVVALGEWNDKEEGQQSGLLVVLNGAWQLVVLGHVAAGAFQLTTHFGRLTGVEVISEDLWEAEKPGSPPVLRYVGLKVTHERFPAGGIFVRMPHHERELREALLAAANG